MAEAAQWKPAPLQESAAKPWHSQCPADDFHLGHGDALSGDVSIKYLKKGIIGK
jgi:hypothetical protein